MYIGDAVLQGASDETRRPDRIPEDVQHAVGAGNGEGRCPDLRRQGYHEEWDGEVYRACEFLNFLLSLLPTLLSSGTVGNWLMSR